ncbi:unnamed protein product [Rotaria sordida]|uniref:F-box domain-containing protein n=2 Tax=Rotaria sordida TaxID=392033 RepID=A0A813SY80_9BILA|nr:unnamed protein product [Rotaria sordida]
MSNNIKLSIEILPVELFHYILDNLDIETIIFSVRHVCRLFRSFVNSYSRYILNLTSISKSNLYLLCRLINPHNIISLTLSNEERTSNQIDLFISLVRLRQFTRLHSITLIDINENQLNFILKRINLKLLTSFSFNIKRYDDRRIKTTNSFLTSIISQSNFRKMEFNLTTDRLWKTSWPFNCSIEYLIVNEDITMDNLIKILQCSPHLYKIILKQKFSKIINNVSQISTLPICFRQLTSLTIEKLDMNTDALESFLLLTPSLVYLKLIGGQHMFDGKRWEQFIEINLPKLEKFEFYFDYWDPVKKTLTDLELIIASFRTPFWIEHKKWFVTCACDIKRSTIVYLYSMPICKSFLTYEIELQKNSLSTYSNIIDNHQFIQNDVNYLSLILSKALADYIQDKEATTNQLLFPKVTKVSIEFYEEWPLLSLQSLSIFINISQIVHMTLRSYYFSEYNQNVFIGIRNFIEQAQNLSSLIIQTGLYRYKLNLAIDNIHSIIPNHVKHLGIPINTIEQIQMILDRCNQLTTIKFDVRLTKFSEEIIKWFTDNTIDSTCSKGYKMVCVWIGTKKTQSTEINVDHKRMKFC